MCVCVPQSKDIASIVCCLLRRYCIYWVLILCSTTTMTDRHLRQVLNLSFKNKKRHHAFLHKNISDCQTCFYDQTDKILNPYYRVKRLLRRLFFFFFVFLLPLRSSSCSSCYSSSSTSLTLWTRLYRIYIGISTYIVETDSFMPCCHSNPFYIRIGVR